MDSTPAQKIGISLLTWCIVLFGAVTIGFVLRETDGRIYPVIQDFRVSEVANHDSGVTISGTMDKRRECYFRELVAYARYDDDEYPVAVPLEFDAAPVVSRSAIAQSWGPWVIELGEDYRDAEVSLYTRHSCHSLWDTSSQIARFSIRKENDSATIIRGTQ